MALTPTPLWIDALAAGVVVVVALGYWLHDRRRTARADAFEEFAEDLEDGETVSFDPPDVSFNVLDYLRVARHLQRGERLAKKGYVKWYRLGSTLGRPTWVKPKRDGSGTPKVTVDGQPYYFPKSAMVADARTGAWVALHRKGEGDPINLRDPAYPGMETDLVERTINLEAESKPPGWLDGLLGDLGQQQLLWLGLGLLFLGYAAWYWSGGGW